MTEFKVEGPEIKKLLKVARKQPIAFAFNAGKKDEDSYLGLDRRKPPKTLGKDAKEQGEGTRFAFGTATVDGKLLILTCEREMPSLAKKLKKYLQTQKVMLNVQVLDASGNVLEADVEDLPDDPELEADEADADEGDAAAPAPEAADEAAPDRGADVKALVARLNALQPQIKAVPAPTVDKLTAAYKGIVEMIRKGSVDQAAAGLDKLEQVVARVSGAAKPASDGNGADKEADAANTAASAAWDKVHAQLQADIPAALSGGVPDPSRLRAVWEFAQGKAATGDFAAALRATEALKGLMVPVAKSEVPKVSNVAFQRSRIMWLDSKKKMKSELDKLRAAIVSQTSDDEDKDEILEVADEMLAEFDQIDERLEDLLDEITNAEEGPARAALRKRASAVIGDYMGILDTPFFKSVDSNPFTSVAVASTARQSLGTIQKTLV